VCASPPGYNRNFSDLSRISKLARKSTLERVFNPYRRRKKYEREENLKNEGEDWEIVCFREHQNHLFISVSDEWWRAEIYNIYGEKSMHGNGKNNSLQCTKLAAKLSSLKMKTDAPLS